MTMSCWPESELLVAAKTFGHLGLSVLPIATNGSKQPVWWALPLVIDPDGTSHRRWKPYQTRRPDTNELSDWFGAEFIEHGIAVITGSISGNLEVIDCDSKDVAAEFESNVNRRDRGLLKKLVTVESPQGRHFYYRSTEPGKTAKLAQAPDPAKNNKSPTTLIDLKGQGGYVIAPPCPGACHPSGKPYVFAGRATFNDLVVMSPEQHNCLIECARLCNRWIVPDKTSSMKRRSTESRADRIDRNKMRPSRLTRRDRPGDDFEVRADWADILVPHDWTCVGGGDDTRYWRRPGKGESGHSAMTGFGDADLLHVFSTSAHPFDTDTWYTKFHAYALLNCDGAFKAAARQLANRGYGRGALRCIVDPPKREKLNFVPRSVR